MFGFGSHSQSPLHTVSASASAGSCGSSSCTLASPAPHVAPVEAAAESEGISPLIWGPGAWSFLHSVACTYPVAPTELQKRQYYTFMLALGNVLPCPSCREHYKKMLVEQNFCIGHLRDRETFFQFIFHLHNIVNTRLHKADHSTPEHYEAFKRRYEQLKNL